MQKPNLRTDITHDRETVLIATSGDVDLASIVQLAAAIEPHLGSGSHVVLDFSNVEFIDSSGLAICSIAHAALTTEGGSLLIRNPTPPVRQALDQTGLSELIEP